jgi:hypothetical protein
MLAAKIAIVLAASSLVSVVTAEKNCTQDNGYKYSVCGDGLKDAQQKCCKADQKCVQVKPFSGTDLTVCSDKRQLMNSVAVKIVIVPLFFMIFEVALAVYLVLRCDKKSPTTMICLVVVALSWPFLFCKYWMFGAYNFFLATMIACAASSVDAPTMPWYMYRVLWALGLFQIVSLLGPIETFHVPLFSWSNAAANAEFITNVYNEVKCDSYYDSYFTILDIEKQAKEADPDAVYNGYCSKNWLATVQSFAVVHTLAWMGVVFVSGRDLLSLGKGSGGDMAKMLIGEGKMP